jgi:uncharacterized protein YebE (UPF0316 family)
MANIFSIGAFVVVFMIGLIVGLVFPELLRSGDEIVNGYEVGLVLSALCIDYGFSPNVQDIGYGNSSFIVYCEPWELNMSYNVSVVIS